MTINASKPILYLITPGDAHNATTALSSSLKKILSQVSCGAAAGIHLVQLREKSLTTRTLFELTERAVQLVRGTSTRILVNDRADVAKAAGAHGVHLTTQSICAATIRKTFGQEFLIGASTHSIAEATEARDDGADFVVFGPVFPTVSKKTYGPPVGLDALREVSLMLAPLPVLALGGITIENAMECLRAGASGIAGISLFSQPEKIRSLRASLDR
jgi:thiamine-phosphate pyrophosphorylase